jgi:acetolactate synthase I/III small subunit
MNSKKYLLSILVDNEPGVLSRIAGLFSGRGYNIETLSVAATNTPEVSRLTMVTICEPPIIEQIKKQLNKLINVITVSDLTEKRFIQRQLSLVKVNAQPDKRAEILRIVDIFRCKIIDVGIDHYIIEVSGNMDKIDAFLNLVKPMGIIEIASTGSIALARENGKKDNGK